MVKHPSKIDPRTNILIHRFYTFPNSSNGGNLRDRRALNPSALSVAHSALWITARLRHGRANDKIISIAKHCFQEMGRVG